ncbi:MAG: DUF4186 domain-containing protein [Methylophilaceae bacterium]|nr:DUF4186 domain-containing protein [Methylophilaceae bacterium]
MRDLDDLFDALARSRFRSRFHLAGKDLDTLRHQGLSRTLGQAQEILNRRLVPADIPNDGRQTPYRGHPVFVAQHATACCCRRCLQKWHHIPTGRALTAVERAYLLRVLERWLRHELGQRDTVPELFGFTDS